MFEAARAALVAVGHEIGKTHQGVLNAFNERFVKDGPMRRDVGRLLKHAEALRYVADYSDNVVDLADAREMVGQARTFVAAVRSIFDRKPPE